VASERCIPNIYATVAALTLSPLHRSAHSDTLQPAPHYPISGERSDARSNFVSGTIAVSDSRTNESGVKVDALSNEGAAILMLATAIEWCSRF
jgi:hypothetical protein